MINEFFKGKLCEKSGDWSVNTDFGIISIKSPSGGDLFIEPPNQFGDIENVHFNSAPTLLIDTPPYDFELSAGVRVNFTETYDAGAILIQLDSKVWAKLSFEFSPDGSATISSVVNKGYTSDSANAYSIAGNQAYLKVTRRGEVYSFFASENNQHWRLVRIFSLDCDESSILEIVKVGFLANSPFGNGCDIEFNNIKLNF